MDGSGVLLLPVCPGAGIVMQEVEKPSAGRDELTSLTPGDSHGHPTR